MHQWCITGKYGFLPRYWHVNTLNMQFLVCRMRFVVSTYDNNLWHLIVMHHLVHHVLTFDKTGFLLAWQNFRFTSEKKKFGENGNRGNLWYQTIMLRSFFQIKIIDWTAIVWLPYLIFIGLYKRFQNFGNKGLYKAKNKGRF